MLRAAKPLSLIPGSVFVKAAMALTVPQPVTGKMAGLSLLMAMVRPRVILLVPVLNVLTIQIRIVYYESMMLLAIRC